MPHLEFSQIDDRVRVEGKDPINRYPTRREDFIRDTCIDISTAQDYEWLFETIDTLVVPTPNTDWFDLPENIHNISEIATDKNKRFKYVSEEEFYNDYINIINNVIGRFRKRYNETTSRFQAKFINPPAAGTKLLIYMKKYLTEVEQFPEFMEETIVKGAVGRFSAMFEGDDLDFALQQMGEYRTLAKQHLQLGEKQVRNKPRRVKTRWELENQTSTLYDKEAT